MKIFFRIINGGQMSDDDLKISMDDIKDMVSELFGEKVEKVGADAARKILKQEMLEFFETGLESVSASQLTPEEEKLLEEYENGPQPAATAQEAPVNHGTRTVVPAAVTMEPLPGALPEIDEEAFHQNQEKLKLEAQLREKIKKELEEEQKKKKEATLRRIEEVKKQSASYQAELSKKQPAKGGSLPYASVISLLNMFEQSQKVFAVVLGKLIKKQAVETMFARTMQKAVEKYPDVLKKAGINQAGKLREDGSLEMPRVAANFNALYLPEEKRAERFFASLRYLFEERLIATELATSLEIKDEVISTIMMQTEKIFEKKGYDGEVRSIFMEHIVPNTTMKSGE
jgi:hypothetical protein